MGKLDIHFKNWFFSVVRQVFVEQKPQPAETPLADDEIYPIQDLTAAMNRLNHELRIPFSLFISGYTYEEIAAKLHLPLGTVKSRIYFAREEFRNQLHSNCYSEN